MNYILLDDDRYYVAEGKATTKLKNATKYSSIEDMLLKVPIMRDWNWDYKLYTIEEDNILKIVEENIWVTKQRQMKSDGLLKHLDNVDIAFIRTTTS